MSIEIKNEKAEKFYVYCYSCWSVNQENGNYGPKPLEFWWLDNDVNLESASRAGEEHEKSDDRNHQVVISGH